MPNMANITVKKADGTTDVVYVQQTPSAGDKTPARWRVDAIGSVPANRPVFAVTSHSSANGQARLVNGKLSYPETYTDTTTGIVAVRNTATLSFSGILPQNMTDTVIKELAAQFANLLKHAIMQEVLTSGYSPS